MTAGIIAQGDAGSQRHASIAAIEQDEGDAACRNAALWATRKSG
jgi:hypothetical protein